MANHMRVTLEIGPKGKKSVAVAPDWPGFERGATTEEAAIERLRSYVPRYTPVTKLAGMEDAFATSTAINVVEHYPGTGSTDFWGYLVCFFEHRSANHVRRSIGARTDADAGVLGVFRRCAFARVG